MTPPATVTLSLVKGRLDPAQYVFDERTTCVLGRSADCSPRLPNDEEGGTVSRHHCLLDINPPDIRIRDFGSMNGTFVNGKKIGQRGRGQTPEEGAARLYPEHDLADGDEIRLGDTVLRVGIQASRTLTLAQCAKCGREAGTEVSGRSGEFLCAECRSEPSAMARLLLELAHSGRPDLAPIAGYTLLRELGRGGMGAVYLARHASTGEQVALKVMLPKVAAHADARRRFLREAELTGALRHPNIAALHDSGFADGTFYLTTEYCTGGSLDLLLRQRNGPLPVARAVRIAVQVLEGLEHAHGQGVVHRDLTPSNILLQDEPDGSSTAKVADFGIAKAFDQAYQRPDLYRSDRRKAALHDPPAGRQLQEGRTGRGRVGPRRLPVPGADRAHPEGLPPGQGPLAGRPAVATRTRPAARPGHRGPAGRRHRPRADRAAYHRLPERRRAAPRAAAVRLNSR